MGSLSFMAVALITGAIFWGAVIHGVERAWSRAPFTRDRPSPLAMVYRHHRQIAAALFMLNALVIATR